MIEIITALYVLIVLAYTLYYLISDISENRTEGEPEENPIYRLQTHTIRYWLYRNGLSHIINGLYQDVVVSNLWINEPFHSKLYEILFLLDRNEFMIPDPTSKVFTLHMKNNKGEVETSKSYQVFSTQKILESVLSQTITSIIKYPKTDAQNIVISICIIVIEQSIHYRSQENSKKVLKHILHDYEHIAKVKHIIDLINIGNSSFKFIQTAFTEAFNYVETEPYNDSQTLPVLQIVHKLPQKILREI
jgi:hypothetical protein